MHKFLIAAALCSLLSPLAAADSLKLDAASAQSLAQDHNPDIQRLMASSRAAGWKRLEAAGFGDIA